MSINNIVSKILEEAKAKEAVILEDAKKQAEKILENNNKKIEKMKKQNLEKASTEAFSKKERLIQSSKLVVRNNKLEAKQTVISNVFEEALNRLENLDEKQYKLFIENTLLNCGFKGEGELIVNKKAYDMISKDLVKKVNKQNNCNLKLTSPSEDVLDGFLIKEENVYHNFTFKAIVESLKAELSSEISKKIF